MDIAIINTKLLTFEGRGLGIINDGGLAIENGKITFVGKTTDFQYQSADHIIDGSNLLTMPGLINSHIHTSETLLRGAAQDLPESEWMNKGFGPFKKHLGIEGMVAGAQLGVLEGIRSGTTTFAEYETHVSSLVNNVYLPFKTRVVAIETINEMASDRVKLKPTDLYELDSELGKDPLKRADALFKDFQDHPLVTSMYGPQALDMVSEETLKIVQAKAKEKKCKIHMHIAQGNRERTQIEKRYGKGATTISILNDRNFLDENLVAAHIHDTTIEERELMVQKDVKMVGCPSSISCIDGILPPIGHYLKLGGTAAIGTDQAPGPGHHNLFLELKLASIGTKIISKDPTALPPWESIKLVTINGAKVLGLDQKIGSLKVGKNADVITLNLKKLNLVPVIDNPFHTIIPNLVYSTNGSEVNNVIINGDFIIKDNEFPSLNVEEITSDVSKKARLIFEAATDEWKEADSQMVKYYKKGFL
ncbi:5'-deoxyadenosine deaminase [Candidatus Lokiarchaeum ossiferum]|uniref:5'-deoxyadenosine deaminase n=1 Tax=Candidatus Lokiarchaeum ossiferum TaxID=2951803 RepID=A0ABY6HMF8_9ARCH|nr:5'-deoxyadenosine deaminase [Candidatus Lokiarchaeum sp. B-35]